MLQWLKDLFSGWYRETSSTIETSLSPRTELERYIDKRVEELLEPEHWERRQPRNRVFTYRTIVFASGCVAWRCG